MTPDDLLTAKEAARACGVRTSAVRKWVANGYLTPAGTRRIGGQVSAVFRRSDVLRCSAERRTSRGGRPRDTGLMTAAELDEFVAERMKDKPAWWTDESKKAPHELAQVLRTVRLLGRGRRTR